MHHIVADAWSIGLLFDEIIESYRSFVSGLIPAIEELPAQYADYALWQQERLDEATLEAQHNYWCRQLEDLPVINLQTDHPRPRIPDLCG